MGTKGIKGILQPVAYWRKWEAVDRDLGGGFQGVAVLTCGHVERVRASKAKGFRYGDAKWGCRADEIARPAHCFCLSCRIARDAA